MVAPAPRTARRPRPLGSRMLGGRSRGAPRVDLPGSPDVGGGLGVPGPRTVGESRTPSVVIPSACWRGSARPHLCRTPRVPQLSSKL